MMNTLDETQHVGVARVRDVSLASENKNWQIMSWKGVKADCCFMAANASFVIMAELEPAGRRLGYINSALLRVEVGEVLDGGWRNTSLLWAPMTTSARLDRPTGSRHTTSHIGMTLHVLCTGITERKEFVERRSSLCNVRRLLPPKRHWSGPSCDVCVHPAALLAACVFVSAIKKKQAWGGTGVPPLHSPLVPTNQGGLEVSVAAPRLWSKGAAG